MEDWKLYIANLGKYNEGRLVGEWFTVPVNMEEVREKIGLNDEYEECAIHDYELPFEIGEYESIERINSLYHQLEDADEDVLADLKDLLRVFDSVEELIENLDNLIFYKGVDALEDLAAELVEAGCFGKVSEQLRLYIDYVAMARDMNIEGTYVVTDNGIWDVNL